MSEYCPKTNADLREEIRDETERATICWIRSELERVEKVEPQIEVVVATADGYRDGRVAHKDVACNLSDLCAVPTLERRTRATSILERRAAGCARADAEIEVIKRRAEVAGLIDKIYDGGANSISDEDLRELEGLNVISAIIPTTTVVDGKIVKGTANWVCRNPYELSSQDGDRILERAYRVFERFMAQAVLLGQWELDAKAIVASVAHGAAAAAAADAAIRDAKANGDRNKRIIKLLVGLNANTFAERYRWSIIDVTIDKWRLDHSDLHQSKRQLTEIVQLLWNLGLSVSCCISRSWKKLPSYVDESIKDIADRRGNKLVLMEFDKDDAHQED